MKKIKITQSLILIFILAIMFGCSSNESKEPVVKIKSIINNNSTGKKESLTKTIHDDKSYISPENCVMPFEYIGKTAITKEFLTLYTDMEETKIVAKLPKGYYVEIIVKDGNHYVIKTDFGLLGYVNIEPDKSEDNLFKYVEKSSIPSDTLGGYRIPKTFSTYLRKYATEYGHGLNVMMNKDVELLKGEDIIFDSLGVKIYVGNEIYRGYETCSYIAYIKINRNFDRKFLLYHDTGSASSSFGFVSLDNKINLGVPADMIIIPGNGNIYSQGHTTECFNRRRKYIYEEKITEVEQPFYYVGLNTVTTDSIKLYSNINGKYSIINIVDDSEVYVILSKRGKNSSNYYLIKTKSSQLGWYKGSGYETSLRDIHYWGS